MAGHRNSEMDTFEALADKSWVNVQRQTFTNWANNALSVIGKTVEVLIDDFDDGILLCQLYGVLSDKPVPKYDQKGKSRFAAAGNLNLFLKLVREDGVQLVNISAEDIMDGNEKLILGLLWKLILRYQIMGIEAGSPKALLLEWVNSKIASYPVAKAMNFRGSWADGSIITALVDSMQPGIAPLDGCSGEPMEDITRAMNAARDTLEPGVPRILEPEFMRDAVDDLSTMAYVSLYKDWDERNSQVRADRAAAKACSMSGAGLDQGFTNVDNPFVINCSDADLMADANLYKDLLDVSMEGPAQPELKIENNGDGSYACSYSTDQPGDYTVAVTLRNLPITGSPHAVNVKHSMDASHCFAEGDGVTDGKVLDNDATSFRVVTCDGDGKPLPDGGKHVEARVKCVSDPSQEIDVAIEDNGDGSYGVEYEVDSPGEYEVSVLAGGEHIKNSPYTMNVAMGLQAENVSGQFTYTVQAKGHNGENITHGGADWQVTIKGPEDADIAVTTSDLGDGRYAAEYTLTALDEADSEFTVDCRLDGKSVANSPFKHRLGPKPSFGGKMKKTLKGIFGKGSASTVASS
eukprot:82231_1